MQSGERGRNGNDGDEAAILVGNKRSDRQPMVLLNWANVSTEPVRALIAVGMVCAERARNAVLGTSETKARLAHQA